MLSKSIFFTVLIILFCSCSTHRENLSPQRISNSRLHLEFNSKENLNSMIVEHDLFLLFYPNLVFKAYQNQSLVQEGSYTYNRINRVSSRIQMDLQVFDNSQMALLELIFNSKGKGFFYIVDIKGADGRIEGTFTLEPLQPPFEQNEAG